MHIVSKMSVIVGRDTKSPLSPNLIFCSPCIYVGSHVFSSGQQLANSMLLSILQSGNFSTVHQFVD